MLDDVWSLLEDAQDPAKAAEAGGDELEARAAVVHEEGPPDRGQEDPREQVRQEEDGEGEDVKDEVVARRLVAGMHVPDPKGIGSRRAPVRTVIVSSGRRQVAVFGATTGTAGQRSATPGRRSAARHRRCEGPTTSASRLPADALDVLFLFYA